MDPRKKIRLASLLLSVVLALVCQALRYTAPVEAYENKLRDLRYRSRPVKTQPSRVVLATVDEASLAEIRIPYSLWSELRAKAAQSLVDAGAVVVAPDLLWEFDPDSVLAYGPEFEPVAGALTRAERSMAMTTIQGPLVLGAFYNGQEVVVPRTLLQGAAGDRLALLNLNEDSDGCIRRQPRKTSVAEQVWPFFAYRAATLAGALEKDEIFWIDYRGPAGSFPRVSFSQLLGPELDPQTAQLVKDKVVLIGSYDPRLGDRHRSPFSVNGQPDMHGVEIHANGVETLLSGDRLKEAPSWVEISLSLLLALTTAWMLAELPLGLAFLGCLALMAGTSGLCLIVFGKANLWLGWADKLLLILLVGGLTLALRYLFIERLRQNMERAFKRYVPFTVVADIMDNSKALELGGSDYDVTVLFSDITNFSTTSERVTPDELLVLINTYFREMTKIIYEHGGTIRQFVGDEIMVIFGAPHRQEDHARRAVDTALAMERRLAEMKKAKPGDKDGFYENKIGLHSGPVLCGNVGSELRMEYTAVGDNVNLGSRIMGLNKNFGTKILLSKDTLDQAGDLSDYDLKSLGVQKVKGREGGIEIFELRLKN